MNLNSKKMKKFRSQLENTFSANFSALIDISNAAFEKAHRDIENGKPVKLFVREYELVGPDVAAMPELKKIFVGIPVVAVRASIGGTFREDFRPVTILPPVEERTHV